MADSKPTPTSARTRQRRGKAASPAVLRGPGPKHLQAYFLARETLRRLRRMPTPLVAPDIRSGAASRPE